jgi:hypothetical protein
MADTEMEIDQPVEEAASAPPAASNGSSSAKPNNAMSFLMANAKGKGKANGEDAEMGMSESEIKALNEKEGLPW